MIVTSPAEALSTARREQSPVDYYSVVWSGSSGGSGGVKDPPRLRVELFVDRLHSVTGASGTELTITVIDPAGRESAHEGGGKRVPVGEDDSPHWGVLRRVDTAAGASVASVHESLFAHLSTTVVVAIVRHERGVDRPAVGSRALRSVPQCGEGGNGGRVQEEGGGVGRGV
jgi:hypothetical protein